MPLACQSHGPRSARRATADCPRRFRRSASAQYPPAHLRRPARRGLFLALGAAAHLPAAGSGLRLRSGVRHERRRDGDLDIYTMDVDGKHVKRLTHTLGYDGGPFFSPDGKQIVYRAYHPQTAADSSDYRALIAQHLVRPVRMDIWVMDADGAHQRQVTNLGGASFAPYFHPDGKRIIFASNYKNPRSRNFDLFLVNVDGSGLEQITTSPEFDAFSMFSPDGRKLVWASNRNGQVQGETNIFIADWVEHL